MLEVDNSRRMTPEIVGSEKHALVLKYVASAGLSGAVQISALGRFRWLRCFDLTTYVSRFHPTDGSHYLETLEKDTHTAFWGSSVSIASRISLRYASLDHPSHP